VTIIDMIMTGGVSITTQSPQRQRECPGLNPEYNQNARLGMPQYYRSTYRAS
jgi:hypothetical protein